MKQTKLCVFGGAFDPPHLGHMNIVKSVRAIIKPDKVLIIPTGSAPHKTTATPYNVRFKLAEAAFPDCEISDIENHPSASYTIDTIRKLKTNYPPDTKIFLIIGSDMLLNFDKWKDYKQILELCTVIAAARDSSDYGEYAVRLGIRLVELPVVEMSSSQIREKFKPKRYIHSINVAVMCGTLSRKYKLSAEISKKVYIAGILHDIMKKSDIVPNYTEYEPTSEELAEPKLWHAISGAKYVRDVLGISDTDIADAIRFHTVGRPKMSMVEKIVYIADKISEERDYKGVEEIRTLAFENLDLAVYTSLKSSLKKTIKKDKQIPPYTINAYHYYQRLLKGVQK
ncbi:MAG: nicotinate (nicotinamide) nucleotide adenylyltransferase [Oscillospiraceae bacterium]|nr:nicotinate (nicotinamide) nucleotide adenylyltransferase [Oscillospiraceae bacterium]